MITKQEVEHIAKLARIGLTEKEIEKFRRELSAILDYVKKLNELDLGGVEAASYLSQRKGKTREMREDWAEKEDLKRVAQMIKAAPDKEKGYIRVKTVFEN